MNKLCRNTLASVNQLLQHFELCPEDIAEESLEDAASLAEALLAAIPHLEKMAKVKPKMKKLVSELNKQTIPSPEVLAHRKVLEQQMIKDLKKEEARVLLHQLQSDLNWTQLGFDFVQRAPMPKREMSEKEKLRMPKTPRGITPPYGTYGQWDFPNTAWEVIPVIDDIPAIMATKRIRNPGNTLWEDESKVLNWFKAKGWA
jgi:hypothetical protein